MEKNIKDYLHLYYYAKGIWSGNNQEYDVSMFCEGAVFHNLLKDFKLILRPLSDIKLSELTKWVNEILNTSIPEDEIKQQLQEFIRLVNKKGINAFQVNAGEFWQAVELINFLRKIHIDVDGLIEACLAIDKTTLK